MFEALSQSLEGGRDTPRAAWVLGLLNVSLLPWFAGLAWFAENAELWIRLSIAYQALTLGFLGGVRCGFAFVQEGARATAQDYTIAILLPLAGWAALIPSPLVGAAMLLAGVLISAFLDLLAAQAGRLPAWYGRLRVQFLLPMVLFLLVILARIVVDRGLIAVP
ncbi:MAG: DUF3429 domain-containing protein [Hyphomicrobiales bacterium]